MLGHLKRFFVPPESANSSTDRERNVAGESLDQEIDAIRQTQMIDPSRLEPTERLVPNRPEKAAPTGKSKSRSASTQARVTTPNYRPALRSPMAVLAILDDGSANVNDAELVRLRGGPVIIGREQGDVRLPHEVLMSSRHAQLECRRHQAGYQWHFTDLNSRNGSFFRIQRALLRDGQEFLIGQHRFTFRVPDAQGALVDRQVDVQSPESTSAFDTDYPNPTSADASDAGATQLVANVDLPIPRLLFRDAKGPQRTFQLDGEAVLIGVDGKRCQLTLPDRYVCPVHARLQLGPQGWTVEDAPSRNGVWLRLSEAKLDQVTEFQLGEQRFFFRPPGK